MKSLKLDAWVKKTPLNLVLKIPSKYQKEQEAEAQIPYFM